MFGDAEGVEGDLARWTLAVAGVSIVLVRPHDERAARDVDEVVVYAARTWCPLFGGIVRLRRRALTPTGGAAWVGG